MCEATTNVALAALGQVQMPPTRLDEGSSREARVGARSTELPTDSRLPYSCTTSHQPPPNISHNYKIDSTDNKEAQKNPVEKKFSRKNPFSTQGSNRIRADLRVRGVVQQNRTAHMEQEQRLLTGTKPPWNSRTTALNCKPQDAGPTPIDHTFILIGQP